MPASRHRLPKGRNNPMHGCATGVRGVRAAGGGGSRRQYNQAREMSNSPHTLVVDVSGAELTERLFDHVSATHRQCAHTCVARRAVPASRPIVSVLGRRHETFSSVKVLIKQIQDHSMHWNTDAKPYVWTATPTKSWPNPTSSRPISRNSSTTTLRKGSRKTKH